jgi:hypothetical protein
MVMLSVDVVIIIPDEGYTKSIYTKAVQIYHQLKEEDKTSIILISGMTRNPITMKSYGLKRALEKYFIVISIKEQIAYLMKSGVKEKHIIHEDMSHNTRENAINSLMLLKQVYTVTNVYLICSVEGVLRKYLTFYKARTDLHMCFYMRIVPVFQIFPLKLLCARLCLVPGELFRIIRYKKLGHL